MKRISASALTASMLLVASCGSSDETNETPTPTPTPPANSSPTVDAGLDIAAYGKKTVTLTAEASDNDGTVESIVWEQASSDETQVDFEQDSAGNFTLKVPDLYSEAELNFAVTATDNEGAEATDTVKVLVTPAERALALSIQGFGQSMKVTNQSSATISGLYSSDHPLKSITVINTTTNVTSVANIDSQWNADVEFITGDNSFEITAISDDDTSITINTEITYYPQLDFTTGLQFDTSVLYVGEEPKTVHVSIGSTNTDTPNLELINSDSEVKGKLFDNGVLPDEIQGDGIYTGTVEVSPEAEGNLCYRIKATTSSQLEYFSENACIWGALPYSDEQVNASVGIADLAKKEVDDAIEVNDDLTTALQLALSKINELDNVETADITPNGGLWWVDVNGILGMHHVNIDGTKSAAQTVRRVVAAAPTQKVSIAPRYYQTNKYNFANQHITPSQQLKAKQATQLLNTPTAVSESLENRIKSSRAAIVSPYINNPNSTSNFGQADDYFSVWKTIETSNSCKIDDDTAYINDGQIDITLDNFKNFSQFGYVHFSTHGDNYYQGLLNLWQDSWGPNDFLKGSLSIVAMYTGIVLPKDSDGNYDITGYEDDLQAKRLAIGYGGSIVVLPSFFDYYLTSLPNSLISLSACRSMYNNSLANVFLAKGAGAVLGYDDYVSTTYAQNTTNTILSEMITNDSTFGEAVVIAKTVHGQSDGGTNEAFLLTAGANDLQLPDGNFSNLDFEQGTLGAWSKDGDGRVIGQLGSTLPTGGNFTGIISTGLGYTTTSGDIAQQACLADSATKVTFNWNFFSEEFLEYCGSQFDDTFSVKLCDASDNSQCVSFDTGVNLLCTSAELTQADIGFDQGDVYSTGWNSQEIDISSLAGKKVTLTLSSSDVGDSIYDSAILIDDIAVE